MLNKILDLLFPENLVCHLCGNEAVVNERGICSGCEKEVRVCPELPLIPHVDGISAGLIYDELTGPCLHRFKYNNGKYLTSFFISYMKVPDKKIDVIVPVPLHKNRQRQRGYNQSELLAKKIAERENIRFDPHIIARTRDTGTQTKLSHKQREKNVKGAFSVLSNVKGLDIVLIDDVITTGSTLSECAKVLKKAGAGKVYALCACARGN
ncbi:MAG: DNA utilization protein GntX [Firmicutes bacterium ADurb.Bin182]|nr:MAG: DNA utilization protein GntX [Firmicutes bacterium ADurb.Bin182]